MDWLDVDDQWENDGQEQETAAMIDLLICTHCLHNNLTSVYALKQMLDTDSILWSQRAFRRFLSCTRPRPITYWAKSLFRLAIVDIITERYTNEKGGKQTHKGFQEKTPTMTYPKEWKLFNNGIAPVIVRHLLANSKTRRTDRGGRGGGGGYSNVHSNASWPNQTKFSNRLGTYAPPPPFGSTRLMCVSAFLIFFQSWQDWKIWNTSATNVVISKTQWRMFIPHQRYNTKYLWRMFHPTQEIFSNFPSNARDLFPSWQSNMRDLDLCWKRIPFGRSCTRLQFRNIVPKNFI